jgi:signal transduction histidine kinase
MPLVSSLMVSVLVEPLEERGLPRARWVEGLGLDEHALDPNGLIEWDSVMSLLDRAAEHLGGPEGLESLTFSLQAQRYGVGPAIGIVIRPQRLYQMIGRWMTDHTSLPLRTRVEVRGERVTVDLSLAEGVRSSQALWYGLRGMFRRIPVELGASEAQVVSRVGEREAHFDITVARPGLGTRIRRSFAAIGGSRRLIEEFQDQQLELRRRLDELRNQSHALRASEARNRALVEELEGQVVGRTRELERRNAQLRALQTQLIQAERLGAAEELAGSVAHSINNPLGALIGQIELMLEDSDVQDPRVEHMLKIAQRIRDVVTRTLQLFRQVELDLTSEDPGRLLDDVCAELQPLVDKAGVDLQLKIEPGLPPLEADGVLLRAALGGLVENAIEVSPRGGTVWLELGSVPSMQVIEIRVVDAGPGIAPELREKVLEPFFTTKPGGTGLGLAIARGVIVGHRGRLSLLPRPGGGTIASVELPLATDSDGVSARAC